MLYPFHSHDAQLLEGYQILSVMLTQIKTILKVQFPTVAHTLRCLKNVGRLLWCLLKRGSVREGTENVIPSQ